MSDPVYDVAVVGAGLVGAAAALALGGAGRHVALIDRQPPHAQTGRLGFDTRTVALNQASRALLGDVIKGTPIRHMRVWEEYGTGCIEFSADAVGTEALAWVVEASAARMALWEACAACPNVELLIGEVADLAEQGATVRLTLSPRDQPADAQPAATPATVSARFVIAADGASSKVCELAGVTALPRGSGDAAVATVARVAEPHNGTALQRFGVGGPVALLPLAAPCAVSVIWSQRRTAAETLAALPDTKFAAALVAATDGALGGIEAIDRRAHAPLTQRVVANCNPRPRLLVLGDAARTLHPLAGQGVNLGLEDVARVLRQAKGERDLGRVGLWRGFALRRRIRSEGMVALMTALRTTYGQRDPVARWVRNVGVRWIDQSAAVKRHLILEAMGTGPVAKRL